VPDFDYGGNKTNDRFAYGSITAMRVGETRNLQRKKTGILKSCCSYYSLELVFTSKYERTRASFLPLARGAIVAGVIVSAMVAFWVW